MLKAEEVGGSAQAVSCQYNASGLRVSKTVDGVTTQYTLHGKLITHLKKGTDELHFFYDAQGKPAMVDFNGTYYAYVHTLQGDIAAIVDNTGTKVVEYGYDAWGKPAKVWSLTHPSDSTLTSAYAKLAQLNPFRYRGYVWDEETGLYYLRSRYYDPAWGRFLHADGSAGFDLFGFNIFCYCSNAVIVLLDADGDDPAHYYFHNAVQSAVINHLIATHPGALLPIYSEEPVKSELGSGRIDIYNPNTLEIWEVKKSTISDVVAYEQIARYILTDRWNRKPNEEGLTPGGFILPGVAYYLDYEIPYWWQGPGVIMYDIKYKGTGVLVPIPSEARRRAREENLAKRQKMVPAYTLDWKSIGIGIGIVVGVGMAWYTGGASLVAMSAPLALG